MNVQAWGHKLLDDGTDEGHAAIANLAKEMDAALDEYLAGASAPNRVYRPFSHVFRLVAVKRTEPDAVVAGEASKPVYTVIESSGVYLWVQPERDEAGNVVSPGHPYSGKILLGAIDDFTNTLSERIAARAEAVAAAAASGQPLAPDPFLDGATAENVSVCVIRGRNYRAS
ncbi:hypothetical protein, partial [Metallibacterium scheffleri]|uniref:hypothetical protein n=1 Tax=Metallibacterium scheffleri TaxID=993689 RepID=UPI0023F0224C